MTVLTRRRDDEANAECWLIFYGDVQVGTIKMRSGNPWDTPSWEWRCGFYPGSHPGECTTGTAATFDKARADFGRAWEVFLSERTDADFQAWRNQRDWTAEKYRRFDPGRANAARLETARAAALTEPYFPRGRQLSRPFTGWIAPACGWRTYSIPFVVRTPPVDVTGARLQERLAVQPLSLCARFCWSRQDRLA
jgi:hypothetical protein